MNPTAPRLVSAIACLLATVVTACSGDGSGDDDMPPLPDPYRQVDLPRSDPAVIAHRGGAAYAPENTMIAFENAARLGADIIELDAFLTRDNKLVVVHDDDLARTTDCTLRVSESRAEEIEACDAAYWWSPGTAYTTPGSQQAPLRGTGVSVPLLIDVLAWNAALGDDAPELSIEIKLSPASGQRDVDAARAFVAEVQGAGVGSRVIAQSFGTSVIDLIKSLDPTIRTAVIVGPGSFTSCLRGVQYAIWRGHDLVYVDIRTSDLTPNCVAYARENGKQIAVWTVDHPVTLERARDLSVDQVVTNFPACILHELQRPYAQPYYTPLIHHTDGFLKCALR